MNKLSAIWTILRNEHYVLVSEKKRHSVSPKWGGKAFWKSAQAAFDKLEKASEKES